ncbi:GNAT family N-acetyltransferase [Plantactinospora siamensis]|uniref:GNAT family N-acetyltransferase n=1 Tax=Plantactinospora siamensis TaxID=555372 RepID=A0ABV6NPD5_9ACTN
MIITLRPARKSDLMTVGALHHRSRVAAYSHFLPAPALARPTPRALGHYWEQRWSYERTDHLLTVAEHNGRIIGFTYVGPDEPGPDAKVGLLNAIHLDPRFQGRGVGRTLMIDALGTLSDEGYQRAVLWVLTENAAARRFYERGGWRCDDVERVDEIGTIPTNQIRYSRDLP